MSATAAIGQGAGVTVGDTRAVPDIEPATLGPGSLGLFHAAGHSCALATLLVRIAPITLAETAGPRAATPDSGRIGHARP